MKQGITDWVKIGLKKSNLNTFRFSKSNPILSLTINQLHSLNRIRLLFKIPIYKIKVTLTHLPTYFFMYIKVFSNPKLAQSV